MSISIIELNDEKYLQHSKSKRFIFKFCPKKRYKTQRCDIGRNVKVYKLNNNSHWEYLCRLEDFLLYYGDDYLAESTLCTIYDDLVEYVYKNQPNKKEKPEYHVGDKVTIRFEYTLKIPETCASCPFYTEREYMNHTVIGFESHCSLGFMNEFDTRFISYKNKKFEQCRLEHFIVEGNEDETTK